MLACLLLNLPDYQQPKRDGDAGAISIRNNTRKNLLKTAQELEKYLFDKDVPAQLKSLPKRVKKQVMAKAVPVDEVFSLAYELRMYQVEIMRMASQNRGEQLDYLFMLDAMRVFLVELQEAEDDIISLLLLDA